MRTTVIGTMWRFAVAGVVACLAGGLVGCNAGHGEYTTEHINASKAKMTQMKSALEWQTAQGDFLAGDFKKALKAVDRSILLNPEVGKSHVLRGRILMETGDLEGALLSLLEAERLEPESVDAQYYLGIANERLERREEALARYQKAAQFDPANAQYLVAAAEMMIDLGRLDEAQSFLEARSERLEHNAAVRQTLGHIAMMRGEPERAVTLFHEARLLAPSDTGVQEDLARAQFATQRFADAEASLAKLLSGPDQAERRDLRSMRARCLIELDRPVDAREVLISLTNESAGSADYEAWDLLGQVSFKMNDLARARQAASRLVAIAPKRGGGYVLRGLVHRKQQNLPAAQESFAKAAAVEPTTETLLMLAMTQHELGWTDLARRTVAAALAKDPTSEPAMQLRAVIEASRTAEVDTSHDPIER